MFEGKQALGTPGSLFQRSLAMQRGLCWTAGGAQGTQLSSGHPELSPAVPTPLSRAFCSQARDLSTGHMALHKALPGEDLTSHD